MNCQQIEDRLPQYLDNDLSSEEKQIVSSHLDHCRDCAALLSSLRDTQKCLAEFPEISPPESLLQKLYAVPGRKKKLISHFEFLSRPSLQPLLAAASVLMMLFSLYYFNPHRSAINKAVESQLHRGVNSVEKLYAKAESLAVSLGRHKDNIVDSVKNIRFFGDNEE